MQRFFRWLIALCVAWLRAVRPQRTLRASGHEWASCRSCRTALDTVWRWEDESYCQACHEAVADSDSSGAFNE